MTPGQRVLDLIKRNHTNQRIVSKALNIPYSTINGWKDPQRNPSWEYILPLCDYFHITPQYLLGGDESTSSESSLSPSEKKLISRFRRLPPEQQERAVGFILGLCDAYESNEEKRSSISKIS